MQNKLTLTQSKIIIDIEQEKILENDRLKQI